LSSSADEGEADYPGLLADETTAAAVPVDTAAAPTDPDSFTLVAAAGVPASQTASSVFSPMAGPSPVVRPSVPPPADPPTAGARSGLEKLPESTGTRHPYPVFPWVAAILDCIAEDKQISGSDDSLTGLTRKSVYLPASRNGGASSEVGWELRFKSNMGPGGDLICRIARKAMQLKGIDKNMFEDWTALRKHLCDAKTLKGSSKTITKFSFLWNCTRGGDSLEQTMIYCERRYKPDLDDDEQFTEALKTAEAKFSATQNAKLEELEAVQNRLLVEHRRASDEGSGMSDKQIQAASKAYTDAQAKTKQFRKEAVAALIRDDGGGGNPGLLQHCGKLLRRDEPQLYDSAKKAALAEVANGLQVSTFEQRYRKKVEKQEAAERAAQENPPRTDSEKRRLNNVKADTCRHKTYIERAQAIRVRVRQMLSLAYPSSTVATTGQAATPPPSAPPPAPAEPPPPAATAAAPVALAAAYNDEPMAAPTDSDIMMLPSAAATEPPDDADSATAASAGRTELSANEAGPQNKRLKVSLLFEPPDKPSSS